MVIIGGNMRVTVHIHGWTTNIKAWILLLIIHDCVKTDCQILIKLSEDIKRTQVYTLVQNMLYYSNIIHEYKQINHQSNFDCPCGHKYICIAPETCACQDCTDTQGEYPSDKWRVI